MLIVSISKCDMSIITAQQITRLFESYKTVDVIFNKNVTDATGLQSKSMYLKCQGMQWPCIIYSSSMTQAKLIANLKKTYFDIINKAKNHVSLRYSFKLHDRHDLLSFFIASNISGYSLYNSQNRDVYFVTLMYTQRPPDDFIEIVGQLLEANTNAQKRKEERIVVTPDSLRKLGLKTSDTTIQIAGVPRKCIIRDISFTGVKILVIGVAKFLANKPAVLSLELEDQTDPLEIPGTIVRYEEVEGRRDIAALGVIFDEKHIPITYKMSINEYFKNTRTVAQK